ncbi:hypothetical protein DUNSADRAFT_16847 [Dunaliella salina]|uniref:Encoded protein n=1 Tax=Dunaliella salina TaxID=3046 RepID=A0ABQ7G2R5_DUNSA|nr:hypothetical protein DUNSADRAFT_16847 [Dunaliella salina]|eukprot:KAF5828902.1 hypothetical protein DUNSADRAFT_16847 [Dunaliella salina]
MVNGYGCRYQKARLAAGAAPNKNIFLLQRLTNQGVQVKRVQRKPQAADNALIQAVTTSLWWRRAKKGQDGTAGELTQLGDSQDESLQIDSNSSSETIKEPSVALCVISNDSGFGGLLVSLCVSSQRTLFGSIAFSCHLTGSGSDACC